MATATEAAASHGERRGRGSAVENVVPGRRRDRVGAALRACWPDSWRRTSEPAPLRLDTAIGPDNAMMTRPAGPPRPPRRARPPVPVLDVLADGGWVVDTPPTGLPTIPAPAGATDAPPGQGLPGAPGVSRPPGKRPRPPAAAVVGASARWLPTGVDGWREPGPPAAAPTGRRPLTAPAAASPGLVPPPRRPRRGPRAAWPGWRTAALGAVWLGLAASWLIDPLFRLVDVLTFGTLLALAALALTASRRPGVRFRDDLLEIWTLPVALLLPPVYALVTHLPLCLLATGRPGRAAARRVGERAVPPPTAAPGPARHGHRRVRVAVALGVAGAAASWLHGLLVPAGEPYTAHSFVGSPGRLAAVAAAALGYALVRRLLLGSPRPTGRRGRRASPGSGVTTDATAGPAGGRELAASRVPSQGGAPVPAGDGLRGEAWSAGTPWLGWWRGPAPADGMGLGGHWPGARRPAVGMAVAELCSGVAIAALWAANPLLMLAAVPPALLLASSLPPDELLAAARTDPKTGLANAVWWREVAEAELARSLRAGRPLSVLLVDIDHFKRVNDRHGHLFGDTVLVAVADALRAATRPWDLVGRFGGEEFVVLLTDVDLPTAADVAERIRRQVAAVRCPLDAPSPLGPGVGDDGDGEAVGVTVSVGAAACEPGAGLASALGRADAALYRAKAAGRDRVHLALADPAGATVPAAQAAVDGPPVQDGACSVPTQVTQAD